jgi:hypothetical protein
MREFAEFRVDEAFAPLLFAERRRLVSEVPDVTVALCRMLDALAMLRFVMAADEDSTSDDRPAGAIIVP